MLAAAIFPLASWVLSPGGSPGGKTGSPGDGGATCIQCHSGANQQASGWITSNIPGTGYIPGQTYTITASATHSGALRYGFELTAEDAASAKKGTFVITNAAETKLVNNAKAVTHTSGGTTPSGSGKTWSFDWTAPVTGTGPVTFYGAFNAANGNGSTSGDVIYVSSLQADEFSTGITDNTADAVGLKAYPNPFSDHLSLSMERGKDVSEVRLVSASGARVWSSKEYLHGSLQIEASAIPAGVYQLVVLFSDGSMANRMVVRR